MPRNAKTSGQQTAVGRAQPMFSTSVPPLSSQRQVGCPRNTCVHQHRPDTGYQAPVFLNTSYPENRSRHQIKRSACSGSSSSM